LAGGASATIDEHLAWDKEKGFYETTPMISRFNAPASHTTFVFPSPLAIEDRRGTRRDPLTFDARSLEHVFNGFVLGIASHLSLVFRECEPVDFDPLPYL
jgi:hypothetical protein